MCPDTGGLIIPKCIARRAGVLQNVSLSGKPENLPFEFVSNQDPFHGMKKGPATLAIPHSVICRAGQENGGAYDRYSILRNDTILDRPRGKDSSGIEEWGCAMINAGHNGELKRACSISAKPERAKEQP